MLRSKKYVHNIDETVGAINGFSLLQAVQYYPHKEAGTTTSFNFLHYTMQAALHVSKLPREQQSSLMEKTFWDGYYNFMWMRYICWNCQTSSLTLSVNEKYTKGKNF